MQVTVNASGVKGSVSAPASKSAMQRAVASALLARGVSVILNPSFCDDAIAAMAMAECLGADIKRLPDRVIIKGGFKPSCNEIFCGESGLGARMFSVLASLHNDWIEIKGSGSLLNRPVNMTSETLTQMGVEVISNNGFMPVKIKGPLQAGTSYVDGSVSSQFLSGLLTALPVLDKDSRLIVDSLRSRQYIDLTIDVLSHFGVRLDNEEYSVFRIPGSQVYSPAEYTVEGDWSGAAFLFVLAAIAGEITVKNISYMSSQPDRHIIDILLQAGADVKIKGEMISVKKNELNAFETDISDCPDLAPPLAVLASFCRGKSVIRGTERLKVKESDRGEVLKHEMSKLGVKIYNYEDRIEIEGPSLIKGGRVDSHGDHRISMALTLLSVAADEKVIVTGAEAVNKSYPSFYDDIKKLGVNLIITE
ncbi:MAG: 3-phosphoshikimate 1-carboxyvinyltransferase [Bacteroidales bacterium]|nr:3-phosphoshikimate 1-carboxyvinyltransferase [Bacteroidales bacterium]